MDTVEYQRLIGALDQQIGNIKKQEEEKKKREDLEQRLKLVEHWISGLKQRLEDITATGAIPVVDVGTKLDELQAERESIVKELTPEKELESPSRQEKPDRPGRPEGPGRLEKPDRDEILVLIAEIERFSSGPLSREERWIVYETWACRWRIVVDKYAQEVTEQDLSLRRCFALIRESMQKEPDLLWFIKALNKDEHGNWEERLYSLGKSLSGARETREQAAASAEAASKKDSEREEAQDAAIWNLMAIVREYSEKKTDESARQLRHQLRMIAKFEHLREEAADIARTHRNLLEPEFSFLWPKKKKEPDEEPISKKLTLRDIVARLLRRMKMKSLIGACHGPFESVGKGFPDHDKGRAKEAIELLSKYGVIRYRSTHIGIRISIEPKMIPVVDRFMEGAAFSIEPVDKWIAGTA